MSPEEYLAIERAAEFRSEYFDGVMFSTAGGTFNHSQILGNLAGEFGIVLKKRPYFVMPADARVWVGKGRLYCYPDLVVACEPRQFAENAKDTLDAACHFDCLGIAIPMAEIYDKVEF